MTDVNKNLENLSLKFSEHQQNINDLINSRSKLETQYQENKIVNEEFQQLDESTKIYKLIGPILLPQDYTEASSNVTKRIEFIEGEIKRVETKIENEEKTIENIRNEIIKLRSS
ncbi:YKE2 [Candida pseudojiufengensis]|uniref:YKE2 n=1 Tax=Candida pseudojiufengensis TaxID=497109 RepID=UPI002224C2AD|nr:YKE2 [Candida pseudojiufengensis]KAI5961903.1 YKE2 [Candida pseudojiufengensis]